jgi:ribonuclease BN (tRNA processing enzyme)
MGWTLRTLGTGTAFPDGVRAPTCSVLQHDDSVAVVDLGSGSLHRLAALGHSPLSIDAVFITHAHFDHFTDLLPLLFALAVPGYTRLRPLDLVLSVEAHRILQGFRAVVPGWLDPNGTQLREHVLQPGESLALGPLSVQTQAVSHTASSIGYRFTLAGQTPRVVAIPGDSGPCDGLRALCADADVAILECSMPDEMPLPAHLNPASLRALAQAAGIRHLLITHRYPFVLGVDLDAYFAGSGVQITVPDDGFVLPLDVEGA